MGSASNEYKTVKFPRQNLPMSKKNKSWRKEHLDWAESRCYQNYAPVRSNIMHKRINYDLFNGIIHMRDIENVLNPEHLNEKTTPENIQNFNLVASKIRVLAGEESKRNPDYRVVVTNPTAISDIEDNKKNEVLQGLQQIIQEGSKSEEEFNAKLEKMMDFFTYEWQDMREVRANCLLNHYYKEYNMPLLFNAGFIDACIVGEEIYMVDVRGGEPIIEKVNPMKIRVFRSGYSNKIEEADVVILEDFWSPGKVVDAYYDVLTKKDIDYIEKGFEEEDEDGEGIDFSKEFVNTHMMSDVINWGKDELGNGFYFDPFHLFSEGTDDLAPFDNNGNIRVINMRWKSRRKIKKVKSYDPQTGEETFNYYPENYILNEDLGEEEEIEYINEAWEGTKIGKEIYVNMRPRPIQYNRLDSPSRCHLGVIGTIYNINDSQPFSIVDMLKPYNYMYDVIHDRLNKLIAKNWGKLVRLDLAKVPKGWEVDKWLYFAKKNSLMIEDSSNEVGSGRVLAGALNNASTGVIDAELGNSIQMHINLLEFIKMEASESVGITRQREGQISNRETVGGVERSTLQSSHITEWWFILHEDTIKRVLEAFIETAKIALKGRKKKFPYITPRGSEMLMDIDGDVFSECDYGLSVDNGGGTQELKQTIHQLAINNLNRQNASLATTMKLFSTMSIAEKIRLVEADEKRAMEQQQQQMQSQQQMQEQQIQAQQQIEQAKLEQQERFNERDNQTKIMVAQINHADDGIEEPYSIEAQEKLKESMRQFNETMQFNRDKLALDKHKVELDASLKRQALSKKPSNNTNK